MKHYHFELGNTNTGCIGLCASINAKSKQDAIRRLKRMFACRYGDGSIEIEIASATREGEYVSIYLNPENLKPDDIDEIDDA